MLRRVAKFEEIAVSPGLFLNLSVILPGLWT